MTVRLTKSQLIDRAATWAQRRNVEFNEERLDQWIRQVLVSGGTRFGNENNKPIFRYGCAHYRRVLQIIRLYSRGVKDRDAIIVELFIKGHGIKPFEVREPLKKEFLRVIDKLNTMLRSRRVDEVGEIPAKHKASLVRSFGEPDPRFSQADLVAGSDDQIAIVRAMRSPDPESAARKVNSQKSLIANFGILLLGGMLACDEEFPNEFGELIAQVPDEQLEIGRVAILAVRQLYSAFAPFLSPNYKLALSAFNTAFGQREFECFLLVISLKFAPNLAGTANNAARCDK